MTKNRHNFPKVIFTTALQKQADYICFLAQQISLGVYKRRGFLILPYLKPGATNTIFFPDFKFPAKFWRQIKKTPRNFGEPFPQSIKEIIEKQIVLPENLFQVQRDLEKYWQKSGQKYPQNIRILITPYGPGSSFYLKNNRISLSFRADRPVFDFNHSLSSALSQAPKPSSIDRLASQKFLRELGFVSKKKIVIPNNLSIQESLVLKELIANKALSHDQIANILWKDQAAEKFSLWAITKLIQKIRSKIKKLGGNPEAIKTLYGRGYCLEGSMEVQFEGKTPQKFSDKLIS